MVYLQRSAIEVCMQDSSVATRKERWSIDRAIFVRPKRAKNQKPSVAVKEQQQPIGNY
jgi:hypothetical protein